MFHTTINGKQHPLGITDPKDEAGAWAALKALQAQLVPSHPLLAGTVGEAVAAFLGAKEPHVRPLTLKNYTRHLAHFRSGFEPCQVASLDLARVEAHAKAFPWSDTNRANYLSTVEACLKFAGVPRVAFHKPGRESAGADSVIPEPVYRACLRETSGDFQQFIRFLWLTGCRPGEARTLTAASVDQAGDVIRLKEHKTRGKTGRARLIYLCPEAVQLVADQAAKHPDGPLFTTKERKKGEVRSGKVIAFSMTAIVNRFHRLSRVVNHNLSAYCFRHTFATRFLSKGAPDAQVAALMGHANTTMLHKHYSHVVHNGHVLRAVIAAVNSGAA